MGDTVPTVPNLDAETEIISKSSAVSRLEDIRLDKGIYITTFQKGMGNDYHFLRRVAPVLAEEKPYEHFKNTNGSTERIPYDSAVWTIKMDSVRDIVICPIKRMPRWGDGSVHYTCSSCGRPCIEEERVWESGNIHHSECI